jgi:hypothetical protein
MPFNITALEIKDSAEYHVTDAAGNPQYTDHPTDFDTDGKPVQIPVTITVVSPGTKKAAAAEFKRNEARQGRVLGAMAGKTSKRTEVDEVNERANFLADITTSLNGFEYPGGAKALYQNLKLGHVANGVETFYNDRGNFIADSLPTSPSM